QDALTRRIDVVEDVVHDRDELMDLLAIDRGNKCLVEGFNGVVRDLVPSVLDLFDLLSEGLGALHVVEQLQQQARPLNALARMLFKEIKKAVLFGQQGTKRHNASFAYLRRRSAHRVPRSRGSSVSRIPSPNRLNASTVMVMASPGKNTSHQ